jgi:hypothetical protein
MSGPFAPTHSHPRLGSELPDRGRGELLLEVIHRAEVFFQRAAELALGGRRTTRAHDVPEERVVVKATAVVAHRVASRIGHVLDAAQELLDRLSVERGELLQGLVQLVRIRLVMFGVVDLHGPGVDVRLERAVVVAQLRQPERVGHAVLPSGLGWVVRS